MNRGDHKCPRKLRGLAVVSIGGYLCEPLLANQAVKGPLVGNTACVGSKPQGAEDISPVGRREGRTLLEMHVGRGRPGQHDAGAAQVDRKSTRLNSSHLGISYAVF